MSIREYAALILAMNESEGALPDLAELEADGSWCAAEIARHVKEYEGINPYA
jgi:hypothetical protein